MALAAFAALNGLVVALGWASLPFHEAWAEELARPINRAAFVVGAGSFVVVAASLVAARIGARSLQTFAAIQTAGLLATLPVHAFGYSLTTPATSAASSSPTTRFSSFTWAGRSCCGLRS
jgi:hypothetical protein